MLGALMVVGISFRPLGKTNLALRHQAYTQLCRVRKKKALSTTPKRLFQAVELKKNQTFKMSSMCVSVVLQTFKDICQPLKTNGDGGVEQMRLFLGDKSGVIH